MSYSKAQQMEALRNILQFAQATAQHHETIHQDRACTAKAKQTDTDIRRGSVRRTNTSGCSGPWSLELWHPTRKCGHVT